MWQSLISAPLYQNICSIDLFAETVKNSQYVNIYPRSQHLPQIIHHIKVSTGTAERRTGATIDVTCDSQTRPETRNKHQLTVKVFVSRGMEAWTQIQKEC